MLDIWHVNLEGHMIYNMVVGKRLKYLIICRFSFNQLLFQSSTYIYRFSLLSPLRKVLNKIKTNIIKGLTYFINL